MKRGTARLGLVLLGVSFIASGSAATADADVLCLRKSGAVIVRKACRDRETVLDPGEVGLVGPSGQPGLPGAMGPDGLLPFEVLDARGVAVGVVASVDGLVLLEHPALERPVLFDVSPEGFADRSNDRLYHELAGCTGAAALRASTAIAGLVPTAVLMGPVAFYETGSFGSFTAASYEQECGTGEVPSTPRGTCCTDTGFPLMLTDTFPAARVGLSVLGFEAPFRMVVR